MKTGPKAKDITGNRYGRLVVTHQGISRGYHQRWWCTCDCGNTKEIFKTSLENGGTQSCGCLTKEVATTHGDRRGEYASLYRVWTNIKSRCSNPNAQFYNEYGGRGIAVCTEWQEFIPFKTWALANGYDPKLEIDRINNNLGYQPNNCRWTTKTINMRNRRSVKGSSSQYIGVCFCNTKKHWIASLKIAGKNKHIGIFTTELEAAQARDQYVQANNLAGFTKNL